MFGTTLAGWFADIKPDFHEILPIEVVTVRGAIVWGNASAPSLLVARFSQAQGSYSVVSVRDLRFSLYDRFLITHDCNDVVPVKVPTRQIQDGDRHKISECQV